MESHAPGGPPVLTRLKIGCIRSSTTALLGAAALAACATLPEPHFPDAEEPQVSAGVDRNAAPEAIAVCHGYGCGLLNLVTLAGGEWKAIRALFEPAPDSAEIERRRVAAAVAIFEQAAGRQLGTSRDRPRTPFSINDPTQLDCVDESINTSSFLHLLAREKLLRWHAVGEPARRYGFLIFGIHFTAVLIEQASGQRYAVDSWFHANGVPPEIVELERWRAGWEPPPAGSSLTEHSAAK